MIRVPSQPPKQTRGKLLLVTIYSAPANLDQWVFGHFYPNARLLPARTQLPPDTTYERFRHLEEAMMADSQTVAKVVALRQLGYEVPERGDGVVVDGVQPNTAASSAGLRKGDLVLAANDQPIETARQFVDLVGGMRPGAVVGLRLKPNNSEAERTLDVTLGARPNEPDKAFLGVTPVTYRPRFDYPVRMEIDSKGIIGPSAGLVLTLGIMQTVGSEDVSRGHAIAATGTVNIDGRVGPIGGLDDKILAAEGQAEYLLVPKGDAEAASAKAKRLKIVGVESVQEALDFLKGLS
jgi:PDZ domain-containing protein